MAPSILSDITSRYSPFMAFGYDWFVAPAVSTLRAPLEERVVSALPEGGRLLDVGCGGGQAAMAFAQRRPDLDVVGVDLSPEQVRRARRRAAGMSSTVHFVEGSALDLPFDEGSFDGVLSVASIKHWPDRRRGIAECARVLRKGARLAIVEADRGCRLDDARAFVDLWRIPEVARPVMLAVFRTWVAGQALDLEDLREAVYGLPLVDVSIERMQGIPAMMLSARKA